MTEDFKKCGVCPRSCGVNRLAGERGFCGEGADLRIASASIHKGEEPPVTGRGGSGTIFISGCSLRCAFCQNYQISQGGGAGAVGAKLVSLGKSVSKEEFIKMTLALQDKGAENINIVTGSHFSPLLISYLGEAKAAGLRIPLLWNSSGYETQEAVINLNKIIDIYLPDLKTLDTVVSQKFFNCVDYPDYAERAIKKMLELKPGNVIIRHLVIPGFLEQTYQVLKWFKKNAAGRAQLSLMTQYTPVKTANSRAANTPDRFLNKEEYETVLLWLSELGIEEGYYQELENSSAWLPDFNKANPFLSELSVPVWHWKSGLIS